MKCRDFRQLRGLFEGYYYLGSSAHRNNNTQCYCSMYAMFIQTREIWKYAKYAYMRSNYPVETPYTRNINKFAALCASNLENWFQCFRNESWWTPSNKWCSEEAIGLAAFQAQLSTVSYHWEYALLSHSPGYISPYGHNGVAHDHWLGWVGEYLVEACYIHLFDRLVGQLLI